MKCVLSEEEQKALLDVLSLARVGALTNYGEDEKRLGEVGSKIAFDYAEEQIAKVKNLLMGAMYA